jgi:hypothetical protein
MDIKGKMDRREFIKGVSIAGLGLEAERKKHNMTLPQPRHIQTAARLGLGTNDPNNIQVDMLNVEEQAVTVTGKLKTTWGAIKK